MVNVEFGQEQYIQQNHHPAHSSRPGILIERVIRISGGKIKTERQAIIVIFVILAAVLSLVFTFLKNSGTYVERGGPGPSPSELEQYKKTQPF